jgi:hypothetical protein
VPGLEGFIIDTPNLELVGGMQGAQALARPFSKLFP